MSVPRRTFCLFVLFDFLLTTILWLIEVGVSMNFIYSKQGWLSINLAVFLSQTLQNFVIVMLRIAKKYRQISNIAQFHLSKMVKLTGFIFLLV